MLTARGIEEFEVRNAIEGAKLAKLNAIRDVLENAERDELSSIASWIDAVLAGTPPDEVALLRRAIEFEDSVVFGEPPLSPDDELADDWPDCVYPYQNLMSRKEYEREKYLLQVELLKLQSWVKEIGRAGRDPVRGPRRGRQGRHDQALHGAPQPPRRTRGRAGEADAAGAGAVVLPALRAAPADRRRDRAVRPLVVQPRRRRAGDGFLHRRTSTPSSCARRPSSSATWCARACTS